MVWLNPIVLVALGVAAAPVLIHLLVQRRAERFAFPTLRFLRPTRLVSIRRHVLDDVPLLLVRCAILAAAAAALAGPLIVTSARRDSWNRRVVRAVVAGSPDAVRALAPGDPVFRTQQFSGLSLRDGITRAVAWLDTAPPARRELVVASTFAIGSIAAADLATVPRDVGIRLERTGPLPAARTVSFGRLLTSAGVVDREVTLAGVTTTVRERADAADRSTAWPLEVVAPPAARAAIDAAVAAVRAQRVWAPSPEHRVRLVVLDDVNAGAPADAAAIHEPWMADAAAAIARDADLQAAARRWTKEREPERQLEREPLGERGRSAEASRSSVGRVIVARAGDGAPLVTAAASADRLVLVSTAPASNIVTPILVRAAVNALAAIPDLQREEVVPIRDDDLRAWSRPALPPPATRIENVDGDDRRWLWVAALLLLAVEMWMRRSRRHETTEGEIARVA